MTQEMQIEVRPKVKPKATTAKLILGLFFDFIGILSYIIPGIAEILDVTWAPISGVL